MGCGTEIEANCLLLMRNFQYPLRAYGLWNGCSCNACLAEQGFQYPLRAYGLWNPNSAETPVTKISFQYPLRAYGLWNSLTTIAAGRRDPSFSTLCGPMGCGTLFGLSHLRSLKFFQYPLRAYGLWNCLRPLPG